jgi:hypothetical protein
MANIYDGLMSAEGGMNGGYKAPLLPENQYAKGINVVCRGGSVKTRPPVQEVGLTFDYVPDEYTFQRRKFQGCTVYHAEHTSYLCCAIGGHVYLINIRTGKTTNVTLPVARFSQYVDRLHFCQVEKYLIVQDGINAALIVEDTNARQADQNESEVVTGTVMAYGHGRLFVKVGARAFRAGDINKPNEPEAVLKFTETTYLAGGGSFSLPVQMGEITAMRFVRNFESGTGNGPLLVFGENGYSSYHVYISRTAWQDQDIARIEMLGQGATGPDALVQMNEDLMYRSWSGLRSHTLLAYESQKKRSFTELAEEIRPFLDQETTWLLPFASMAAFQDRVLFTIAAEKVTALDEEDDEIPDVRFRGLASLDFSTLSGITSMSDKRSAAWDGVWTGFTPTAIVSGLFDGVERCFVFSKTDQGVNALYELGRGLPGLDNAEVPISCRLYTKGMSFKTYTDAGPRALPYEQKKFDQATLYLMGLENDVNISLWLRPDGRGIFTRLASKALHAPVYYDTNPPTGIPEIGGTQSRPKFIFHAPSEASDPYLKKSMLWGGFLEFCIEWSGYLEWMRFGAQCAWESNKDYSTEEPTVPVRFTDVERSDFSYDLQRRVA